MTFTPEQIEEIESLAGINYTIKQMAMYFNIPVKDLQREFENKDSEFRFHYDRGQLVSQATIDMKVYESAKGGNTTAQQQIEKIRAARKFENIRDQLLYGNS
jgi:ABC-type uncharacterized transport system ATPase subunit